MIRFPRLRTWVMIPKKRQQKLPRNDPRQNKARMTYKLNGESKMSCLLPFQCPPYYSLKCHKSPPPPNPGGGEGQTRPHGLEGGDLQHFSLLILMWLCKLHLHLRWLDWIFWGGYLPSLGINYFAMSKDMEKRFPQLYYIKMKIFYDLGFIAIGVAVAT